MTTPLNPFGFFERTRRPVTPFHELSTREQRRQENSLLRILPLGTTRQQARATLSRGRRSGRVFRSGPNATPEQSAATQAYQQRSARSRLSSARRRYGVPTPPPPEGPQEPGRPVTGFPGRFNPFDWNFTPVGQLVEPNGYVVTYPDPNAAEVSQNLSDKEELAKRKSVFMQGFLDEMALTENPPGEYTKAKFEFNPGKFEYSRRNWNHASYDKFLQMTYDEYRAYGKEMEARNKEIQRAGGKPVRGDWQYH